MLIGTTPELATTCQLLTLALLCRSMKSNPSNVSKFII
jgi:hypothetical protein